MTRHRTSMLSRGGAPAAFRVVQGGQGGDNRCRRWGLVNEGEEARPGQLMTL